MSTEQTVQWSALPGAALSLIAGKLGPKIGHLRLRSVCSSWRRTLSLQPLNPLSFPLTLPIPTHKTLNPDRPNSHYSLTQRILCRLSPPPRNPNRNPGSNGWLVKLQETKPNTFSLFNPLTTCEIIDVAESLPDSINLLHYGVSQVAESYTLELVDERGRRVQRFDNVWEMTSLTVKKVAVASNFVKDGDFVVLALFGSGKLGFWGIGQEDWTMIECGGFEDCWEKGFLFDDVIFHNGKFYAVDFMGNLLMINSPLKSVLVAQALHPGGERRKFLIELMGELLVVDKENDSDLCVGEYDMQLRVFVPNGRDNWWDIRRYFHGRALFLGEDVSFSLTAKDFIGCKEDCIYFVDDIFMAADCPFGEGCGVFNLRNWTIKELADHPEGAKLFWPPPTWLV